MTNIIDYITINSTGNATNFGDLTEIRYGVGGTSNGTDERGVFGGGGGWLGSYDNSFNVIDYITINSTGDASDFGDLPVRRKELGATSNDTNNRGIFGGGLDQSFAVNNTIEYVTLNSTGNATDFGDMIPAIKQLESTSNGTNERGVFGGGYVSGAVNTINYITINTPSNTTDFGDLTVARYDITGTSNGVNERGIFAGSTDTIDYITINSTGNATDFGNLSASRNSLASCSNIQERGVFGGGSSTTNVIDYVTINSTGNASDFGDLTLARYSLAACSNS